MNYIKLINAIWELREQGMISVHEHDFYCYLVHKSNRLGWKNPFYQSSEIICAVLGINRKALSARRSRLQQLGLIKFKEGVTWKKPPQYTLLLADKENDSVVPVQDLLRPVQDNKTINKTKQIFLKPSIKEINDYCYERKNEIDANAFFDFYESKDWMIGKNKMKDWKAAIRSWENSKKSNKHYFAKHENDKQYEKF